MLYLYFSSSLMSLVSSSSSLHLFFRVLLSKMAFRFDYVQWGCFGEDECASLLSAPVAPHAKGYGCWWDIISIRRCSTDSGLVTSSSSLSKYLYQRDLQSSCCLLTSCYLLHLHTTDGASSYIYFLQRERHSVIGSDGASGKLPPKPIIYFQTWRIGIVFFFLGNCLNFISFGYATQSLLAALGSVQFVSNIAFAYFVLNKMVTVKVLVATAFIVLGNIFLVAFCNHQSHVYTPEQLAEKYTNVAFLMYLMALILVVVLHYSIYRRGELLLAISGQDLRPHWLNINIKHKLNSFSCDSHLFLWLLLELC